MCISLERRALLGMVCNVVSFDVCVGTYVMESDVVELSGRMYELSQLLYSRASVFVVLEC